MLGDFVSEVDELMSLYDYPFYELGEIANGIRTQKHQRKVYFNMNRHINPSNICSDICTFCAFSSHRKNPNPYEMTKEEILKDARSAHSRGAMEVHIVSAHNPHYSYEWYFDLFRTLKQELPNLHIKSMTAAEVDFLHRKFKYPYEKILDDMALAGVDSMPGGGAEIFSPEIRKKICRGKVDGNNWLKIHRYWHSLGKKSNVTMLFGHIENRAHRIDHMLSVRDLQDETGGFNAFIPLVYQRSNNFLAVDEFLSGVEILKTIAISRIILENIPHIKAYWATLGLNFAVVAQEFGANDIDGTIEKENIQSAGGAKSKGGVSKEDIIHEIKDAGFTPVLRDSLYNELEVF